MMHVGLGWALARLRRSVTPYLAQLDPLLGWLAVDGYGFHEGYFDWPRYVEGQRSRLAWTATSDASSIRVSVAASGL